MKNGLEGLKVGDRVATIRYISPEQPNQWTGALHAVTKVTPTQFMAANDWYLKSTGKRRGRGVRSYHMVKATTAMLEEVAARAEAKKLATEALEAFHARADYKHASFIGWLLSSMTPEESNVLDRLSLEEWETLHNKLTAKCICIKNWPVAQNCPVHGNSAPVSINSSMAALS